MTNKAKYLDYVNNFLTLARFAEYYELSISEAERVLIDGKRDHEIEAAAYKRGSSS